MKEKQKFFREPVEWLPFPISVERKEGPLGIQRNVEKFSEPSRKIGNFKQMFIDKSIILLKFGLKQNSINGWLQRRIH